MSERGSATYDDVRDAILSATSIRKGDFKVVQRWVLDGGKDRDGDMLTVCVEILDDLVVITVF
jgi:hypothetical protein